MSSERRFFAVTSEPTGALYRAILHATLQHCDRFSLVQRHECIMDEAARTVLSELSPYLLLEKAVSEWPGTKLLRGEAILREYELSEASATILGQVAEGLYEWCQPRRPEDPVFWRKSDGPWLVTIAHERDAYIVATPDEIEELLRVVPPMSTLMEIV